MENLSSYIDHTLLSPTASETAIRKICEEAWIHQFKAVCVPPVYVPYVMEMLEFCPIKIEVATVIGFPMGYSTTATKLAEAREALQYGATELDVVMNLAQFKSMAYLSIREELRQLADIAHERNALLKVIIETAYLDAFDLYTACEICAEAKADFVKTSTGFAPAGADVEIVRKMRSILPPEVKIKASGGIKTYEQAIAMIDAGAARIGTSSGVAIVTGA
ncbi:deoxyribose-phosphate aldolase [Dyadobacter fermentans]|uniref:Deoxyribose-phosphate aldolase n=1 Tax=Dyadobacter fermentans (strain ATCC 700827 / DSM 18053 / CIP 107007 / KCTC 52180 / NS114) TaxID=471854 RepID=C6VXX1_DYAFD|nr:deoxyribose-phosphate aldolase [Dyadobacter fermentans]ACT95154.1 deoxyribose-phosphate aldolase [Dyadobacter fermentans DSM 18053]